MKLVTYLNADEQAQLAIYNNDKLYDMDQMHPDLPMSMAMFLNYWDDMYPVALMANKKIKDGLVRSSLIKDAAAFTLLAPVPHPSSYRVGDDNGYPSFYFSNHNSIKGEGNISCMQDHLNKLGFQIQVGIVISKGGKNIKASEADDYIAGFCIVVDFLTTANKTKQFATTLGASLVTLDELDNYEVPAADGHVGKAWSFGIKASINNEVAHEGKSTIDYTIAELIEQCSYGVDIFPGDIIAVGSINIDKQLQENDTIEIEVEGLGKLSNTIVKDKDEHTLQY